MALWNFINSLTELPPGLDRLRVPVLWAVFDILTAVIWAAELITITLYTYLVAVHQQDRRLSYIDIQLNGNLNRYEFEIYNKSYMISMNCANIFPLKPSITSHVERHSLLTKFQPALRKSTLWL